MSNNDFPIDNIDELDQVIDIDCLLLNNRISVRYRRSDIKIIIKTHSLLFPRLIDAKLVDISSKGIAIHSQKKLRVNGRVSIFLQFNDGKRFTVLATVSNKVAPRYGLKFDTYQTELADYLLATQTDLTFG
jgi:hypothetical protein